MKGDLHEKSNPSTDEDAMEAFLQRVASPLRMPELSGKMFEERVMAAVYKEQQEQVGLSAMETVAVETNSVGVNVAEKWAIGQYFDGQRPSSSIANIQNSNTSSIASSWWWRPRTVHLSPLAGLGIAMGMIAIVTFGILSMWPSKTGYNSPTIVSPTGTSVAQTAQAPIPPDTIHLVRFVLMDPQAQQVYLVGDFNAWDKTTLQLRPGAQPGVWTTLVELTPGRYEYAFIVQRNGKEHWVVDPSALVAYDEFRTESSVLTIGGKGRAQAVGRML